MLLYVRATINLPGLRVGRLAYVDPTVPYIARCLERALLVPVGAGVASDPPDEGETE